MARLAIPSDNRYTLTTYDYFIEQMP